MQNELVKLEALKPVQLFNGDGLEPILTEITKIVDDFEADVTTPAGRKEIASLANKVARSKTTLDALGKELVAEWKEKSRAVDESRKQMRDYLDELKERARRPLTEWEQIEQERIQALERRVQDIRDFQKMSGSAAFLKDCLSQVETIQIDDSWGEKMGEAAIAKDSSIAKLRHDIEAAEIRENEERERERLRKEEEERQRKLREEQIAREARERAERDLKEKADRERRDLEEQKERAEQEKREANERARRAEEDKQRAIDEAKKNEELAAARERQRIEAEQRKEQEERERREANNRHRGKVHREIVALLMHHAQLSEDQSKAVVKAIAGGAIGRVSIRY